MICISDTHPLVWLIEGDRRLSQAAKNALEDATQSLVIPTILLAEIAHLYARRRITTDLSIVLTRIANQPNCSIYPLDEFVVEHLPTTLNIHDAIIVATAIYYRDVMNENVAVITKDAEITRSGLVDVIW